MGLDNVSKVRNKIKRQELYRNSKIEKSKSKITLRKERAQSEKLDPKLKEAPPHKSNVNDSGTTKDKHPCNSRKQAGI